MLKDEIDAKLAELAADDLTPVDLFMSSDGLSRLTTECGAEFTMSITAYRGVGIRIHGGTSPQFFITGKAKAQPVG